MGINANMVKKLFKVKIETEVMVMAKDAKEAGLVAKQSIARTPDEIESYGKSTVTQVNSANDIPDDWKYCIPFCPVGAVQESMKCCELISKVQKDIEKGLDEKEVQEIIRIRSESKQPEPKIDPNVIEGIRPDPKPKELGWNQTKSGRPNPFLRFKI